MSTTTNTAANGQEPSIQPLFDFWWKSSEQGAEWYQAWLGALGAAGKPEDLRRRWLDAVSKSLDQYMRSPVFLEAMRRNFEMLTHIKGTTEDWARDVTRTTGVPRIGDISGLFERMRIGHDAILARLSAIEEKLDALEQRKG